MRADRPHRLPDDVDPTWRIGIVASSHYKEEVGQLVDGAVQALLKAGLKEGNIQHFDTAGSFEIPLIGAALAREGKVDALIGLGIIVEGETHHAALLAQSVARGIMDVQVQYRVPFAFEVLYVERLEQARGRLGKGDEAARAVLHSLATLHSIRS